MRKSLVQLVKYVLTGRKLKCVDNLIFSMSAGRLNGNLLGNRLRNALTGKLKNKSYFSPIFMGGCARSGTTLMQMLLRLCHGLGGPYGEVCIFQDITNEELIAREFETSDAGRVSRLARRDLILASDDLLREYQSRKNLEHTILKAPKYVGFLGELFHYFPESKFIHIIRDGRDVALSMLKFYQREGFYGNTYPFDFAVKSWVVSIKQGELFRSDDKRYIEVRYEDLVREPYSAMQSVSEFVGVQTPSEERIQNFSESLDEKKVAKTHKAGLMASFYTTSIGRWRHEMSPSQKNVFKRLGGDVLIQLGYEKNPDW